MIITSIPKHRIIAIYLPQFHPIKENDEWWGKGFTEWINVVKSKPRFPGHYQPHLPADLGFYDLRVPEVRIEQAKMASEYGIFGFCYYHYWFNGRLLLERPLEDMLNSKEPNFPFMICWANEDWKRTWYSDEEEILVKQNYSEEDDINHIHYLMKFFKDPRYIRINNMPVICIYRSTSLPNTERTIELWQREAVKEGLKLYICRFESFGETGKDFLAKGIDASIDFPPHKDYEYNKHFKNREIIKRIINKIFRLLTDNNILPDGKNYKDYIQFQMKHKLEKSYKWYPCITPMWDNSPRRKKNNFLILNNSTPKLFGKWLQYIINNFNPYSNEENFIFINAWNEWAEGNHLEPDMKWGNKYLLEIKKLMFKC